MTAKQEVEEFMNGLMGLAVTHIEHSGTFNPFFAVLTRDDKGEVCAVEPDRESDTPTPPKEMLREIARQRINEGDVKIVALIFDFLMIHPDTRKKVDAVHMQLTHADGYAVDIYVPYRVTKGKFNAGELISRPGHNVLFGEQT